MVSERFIFCLDSNFQRVIQKYKLDYPGEVDYFDYEDDANRLLITFKNGHYAIYCVDPLLTKEVDSEKIGFREYAVIKGESEIITWKRPTAVRNWRNAKNVLPRQSTNSVLQNVYDMHQGFNSYRDNM